MKILIYSLSLLTLFFALGQKAGATEPACVQAVNSELAKFGMGSYSHPSSDVSKTPSDAQEGAVFERKTGTIAQTVTFSTIDSSHQQIRISIPSLLFRTRHEDEEITLGSDCKIERIDLNAGGDGIDLTPEMCQSLEKAGYASVPKIAKQLPYQSGWTKDEALGEVAKAACVEYKGKFATPGAAAGGEANGGSAR